MEQFICERIPVDDTTSIDLALGFWADLLSTWDDDFGWHFHIETNEPEWVDIWEIYEHFRRPEMTWAEWKREIQADLNRSKVQMLEKELELLRGEMSRHAVVPDQG